MPEYFRETLQQSIISKVRELRAYLIPPSLDNLGKRKLISAPLISTSIWNIPPESEKALVETNGKRKQNFSKVTPKFHYLSLRT